MADRELTEKQERFCQEVAAGENYTTAALRAGYSPKTAWNTGWQNMQKRYIRKRIAELQDDVAQEFSFLIEPAVKTLFTIMDAPGASESARVSAAEKLLKLTGAMVDKSETKITKELSDEAREFQQRLTEWMRTHRND